MRHVTNKISIPNILEVERGAISSIGALISKWGFKKVVLFFGTGIKDLFGKTILDSIKSISEIDILKIYEFDDIDITNLIKTGFSIPGQAEIIIGVGGGKVLDASKYISFLNNLPFISIPTSTSNDGFSSSGCSLIIDGKRTSVHARMPFGIIVDIEIIKTSPDKYIFSGIGDLVYKITALNDWKFEEKNNRSIIDDFAALIAYKSINSIIRIDKINIRDESFIVELVDSLTMSGIAMEIANSAPASGSEHLISHALDKIVDTPQLHGIQVGVATYIMSKVQNHRHEEITKFFKTTGFFDFVKGLRMKTEDFAKAIDLAPSIKPNRYTYLHLDEYRNSAKDILTNDIILNEILYKSS